MKLSRTVEYTVLGLLIAYIAIGPRLPFVQTVLSTPLGKAFALAGIVYVWKFVSAAVALLLAIMFVRCAGGGMTVWEGLEMPEAKCTCPEGYTFNATTKTCSNKEGKTMNPTACACDPGYSYDFTTKECKQNSVMSEPIPPVVPEEPLATAAPAVSTGPVTSTAPVTTPGAAQDMATATPPAPSTDVAGPTATGTESFSLMGYPLY
jgi:hypothetical protein